MYEDWGMIDDAAKERLSDFALQLVMGAVYGSERTARMVEDAVQDLTADDETPEDIPLGEPARILPPIPQQPGTIVPVSGKDLSSSMSNVISAATGNGDIDVVDSSIMNILRDSQNGAPFGSQSQLGFDSSVQQIGVDNSQHQFGTPQIGMNSNQYQAGFNDLSGVSQFDRLACQSGVYSQPVSGTSGSIETPPVQPSGVFGGSNSGGSFGSPIAQSSGAFGNPTVPSSGAFGSSVGTPPVQPSGAFDSPVGSGSPVPPVPPVQSINPANAQNAQQAFEAVQAMSNSVRKSDEKNYFNQAQTATVFEYAKRQAAERAASSKKLWEDLAYDPQPGKLSVNGKPYEFKFVQKNVGWGQELTADFETNFKLMKRRITESVRDEFGGFARIKEIVVQDGCLITNRIMFCPMIEPVYIAKLPQDLQSAVSEGHIAEFFDWSSMKAMKGLYAVTIDNSYFYCTTVLDDLGVSRRGGVSTIFKVVPSLDLFTLEGNTINRDGLDKPESHEVKETVRRQKRNLALLDGFKLNVYSGGDYLQETCWNSTKQYIENRGNKNLIRFCGGLALRGAASTVVTAGNMAAHTIGWGLKLIGGMLKSGMEPIQKEEHFTQ